MKKLLLSLLLLAPIAPACASEIPAALLQENDVVIQMHNRILAKILDKPITVADVMKKMDINFFRQFPQYAGSKRARLQYYQAHWKNTLSDLIDKELILHDAETSKIPPPTNEVREEMETTFGPNVIANLEKIGLSYEEAAKSIEEDILLRRMLIYRAQLKAMRAVTPQMLRNNYRENKEKFAVTAQWTYRVISIRDKEPSRSLYAAQELAKLLKEHPLDNVEDVIKAQVPLHPSTSIKIAESLTQQESELSPQYKEILSQLAAGEYSAPIEQTDRKQNKFFRIFYLESHQPQTTRSFQDVAGRIKNVLLDQNMNVETEKYINDLKKKFGVNTEEIFSSIPPAFEPFTLHQIK